MKYKLMIALGLSLALNGFLMENTIRQYFEKSKMTKETVSVPVEINDTLSEWQMFTLALMKVESEFHNEAVSSVGAKGYFQMTPIYIKEVNRVHHTNYTFADATDFEKAYQIFDLMQKAHNPDYDMKKALELHNGKHEWYNRRVFNVMKEFRVYEEMRSKVKNI